MTHYQGFIEPDEPPRPEMVFGIQPAVRDSHPADENYPEFATGLNRPIPHLIPQGVASPNADSSTRDETRTRKTRRSGDFESTNGATPEAADARLTRLAAGQPRAPAAQSVREPHGAADRSPLYSPPPPPPMASPVTRSTHTDFLAAVIREITVPPATIAAADLAGLLVDLGSSVTELSVIALPEKRRFHARYAMAFAACCAARAYWLAREIEARAAADAADAPGASL